MWSFTSPPLEATVHLYFFTVDGMTMADRESDDEAAGQDVGQLVEVPGDRHLSGNCRMFRAVPLI